MKGPKINTKIDWRSKIIDLLIVIIGITIAFKLNSWNDSFKNNLKVKDYLHSFYDESVGNRTMLVSALEFSKSNRNDIDSLKKLLLSKNYDDKRIKSLTASMMVLANYSPSTTTMQNILASGEFDLLKDNKLQRNLTSTYNAYKATAKLESLVTDYIDRYVTPFLFENVRFSNFSSINSDFTKHPSFENIVFGYIVLLDQLIAGYEKNLEELDLLNKNLNMANHMESN